MYLELRDVLISTFGCKRPASDYHQPIPDLVDEGLACNRPSITFPSVIVSKLVIDFAFVVSSNVFSF
jgi:hypothetical protein